MTLPALLTQLKTVCGAGGTLKDGVLEIQAIILTRVRDTLTKLGFALKSKSYISHRWTPGGHRNHLC